MIAASCKGDDEQAGGLMLLIAQDGSLELDRLDLLITANGETLAQNSYRVPVEAPLPTSVALVSSGNPEDSARITVVGWRGDEAIDRRDALVVRIPKDRVAALRVVLSERCTSHVVVRAAQSGRAASAESVCTEGETCDPVSAACHDATVDASRLPSYREGDEDIAVSLGGAASDPSEGGGAGGTGQVEEGSSAGTGGVTSAGGGPLSSAGAGAGGEASPLGCSPSAVPASCSANTPQYCDEDGSWRDVESGACTELATCDAGNCRCNDRECGGSCVDTQTDADNCGECEHACVIGSCSAGRCTPVELATGVVSPVNVAIGSGYLYWSDNGVLKRLDPTSHQISPVAIDADAVNICGTVRDGHVAATSDRIYWTGINGCYRYHGLAGVTSSKTLYYGSQAPSLLAAAGPNAFWTNMMDYLLRSTDGSNYWAYHGGITHDILAVAADLSSVYWLESQTSGSTDNVFVFKHSVPQLDANAIELANEQDGGVGMAVSEGYVYWTTHSGKVQRVSTTGGQVKTIASGFTGLLGIAVDVSGVYFAKGGATGAILRVPHAGGAVTTLAENQNGARGLTLDSSKVYWANTEGGQIMTVSK